jgi:hypothetical protein
MIHFLASPFLKYGIIILMFGSGALYIKAKLTDIITLKENNAKLLMVQQEQKIALKQKEIEIQSIVASYEKQKNINKTLEENMVDLKSKFNKIKEDGSKRDFGELLLKKGGLIEKIINKGTQKVFECFESISRNEANDNCDGINSKS